MDEEISKPRGLPEENGRENDAGVQFVLESKGKWWHAGYHLTTAIVGPTILALPYTFSGMGWAVGFLCLTVIGLVTFYAYYLMSKVLDHCEKQGRRHFRFRELAADVFGSGWMFYFVIIVQTAVNTGVAIGTILLSGECIENNDGKCVRQKELLSTCMDAQTGKSRKPWGSINYHLQRLSRGRK
ncbi:probable GABA transporter 2 isoform X3 [Macadamia integrifolia]|uniref:probable GABA transporter 2 isoform X3 n=1 Tax=Macadamia integrifolia TaxID=60698 RepID=UPI001C532BDC|nr:probable GABA transporter 2 isoform X3 [Macadamia integrifolia]